MKGTKEEHEYFKEFFAWEKDISEKVMPACSSYDEIKPMKVSFPVDLSAAWKFLMRGGAVQVKIYPYHCCSISSDELAQFKKMSTDVRTALRITTRNVCAGK